MNTSGQEFSAFRLLIDAILVLLILIIIIGIMGWVTSWRFQLSEKRLYEGFQKAVNAPIGKTVVEESLSLRADSTYTSSSFAKPGVPKECIKFKARALNALQVGRNGQLIDITEDIQIDVFYMCERQFDDSDCDVLCEISFGKEFEEDEE